VWSRRFRPHLEAEQHLVLVGQIADHASQRRRKPLDERRRRENLVVLGRLWMLENVDDLKVVLASELLIADAPQVGDGGLGLRRLTRDVELENELRQVTLLRYVTWNAP
jgi:hypothetical protein